MCLNNILVYLVYFRVQCKFEWVSDEVSGVLHITVTSRCQRVSGGCPALLSSSRFLPQTDAQDITKCLILI